MKISDYNELLPEKKAKYNIEDCSSVEEWRKKVPMDYFAAVCILLKADKGIERDELFKTIYQVSCVHTPKRIYKYCSLSDDKKLNEAKFITLVDKKIFMSSIDDFNDPFDGKGFYYDKKALMKYGNLSECNGEIVDFQKLIKCTCFSGNGVNSMPMWAHYSNNHKGYCIEYDVEENDALKGFVLPIQYTDDRLDITEELIRIAEDVSKLNQEKFDSEIYKYISQEMTIVYLSTLLYHVKHTAWSYEDEYRLFLPSNTLLNPYISASPKAIYVGLNCDADNIERLKQIGDYLDVPVYKMHFDENDGKFELKTLEISIQ